MLAMKLDAQCRIYYSIILTHRPSEAHSPELKAKRLLLELVQVSTYAESAKLQRL